VTAYPKPASGAPKFPELELDVLDFWDADDTFRASVARRDGAPEYVFYDGPPFANGLPHYGHLLTGYVKDIVPRYRTMRGYKVERRFGWDTHGLPAERRLPGVGTEVHERMACVRHPPGTLGRLRQRLQDT
jgi:isoleucyl-tRNA synthetase